MLNPQVIVSLEVYAYCPCLFLIFAVQAEVAARNHRSETGARVAHYA